MYHNLYITQPDLDLFYDICNTINERDQRLKRYFSFMLAIQFDI